MRNVQLLIVAFLFINNAIGQTISLANLIDKTNCKQYSCFRTFMADNRMKLTEQEVLSDNNKFYNFGKTSGSSDNNSYSYVIKSYNPTNVNEVMVGITSHEDVVFKNYLRQLDSTDFKSVSLDVGKTGKGYTQNVTYYDRSKKHPNVVIMVSETIINEKLTVYSINITRKFI